MSLGDKLAKLRKDNNYTQEQLADILDVSRQSVSKWESDVAYPETEKLVRLSKLYNCSIDYLLKDTNEEQHPQVSFKFKNFYYERKSSKMIRGIPLWHINIGLGRTAKGIIAIGFNAKGIISFGFFSLGLFSFGLFSLGLLSIGVFALGLIAAGSISAGIIAFGAVCFGVLAIGAVAIGEFSIGALAIGKYFALGDYAYAAVAIGKTKAVGTIYQAYAVTKGNYNEVISLLDTTVPKVFTWIAELIKSLLKVG